MTSTHRIIIWDADLMSNCKSIFEIFEVDLSSPKNYRKNGKLTTAACRIIQNLTRHISGDGLICEVHRIVDGNTVKMSPVTTDAPLGGYDDSYERACRVVGKHLDAALSELLDGRPGDLDPSQWSAISASKLQLAGLFIDICQQNNPYSDEEVA